MMLKVMIVIIAFNCITFDFSSIIIHNREYDDLSMKTKMKMIAQWPQIINMVNMMIMETLATVELFKERPLSTSSGRSMLKIQ